jgi:hypothetical protein
MPAVAKTVISAGTQIFGAISQNKRANAQQKFQQQQEAMQAEYNRDASTTTLLQDASLKTKENSQSFSQSIGSGDTTKYAIAAVAVLAAAFLIIYTLKD